jgi:hypothetical protein
MTKLDQGLRLYTLLFSAGLIVIAFSQGFSVTNLTLIALFLPVPGYLLLQIVKRYYLWRSQVESVSLNENSSPSYATQPQFSVKIFITQKQPLFIISLILLITLSLISFIRLLSN